MASELEFDLQDTMDWDKKWLVDFNAGNIQLASFDQSDNTVAVDVKMDGSVFKEKSSFTMQRLTFCSKLSWGSYIISIVSFYEPLFILWGFFLLSLLCISINLPYGHAWSSVLISGLLLLVATWHCLVSYKTR